MPGTPDPQEILNLPIPSDNDAGAGTVRDYLMALLTTLWKEKADFSGKRPFGNSGWDAYLQVALIQAGCVAGTFDEEGYIESVDSEAVDLLVLSAITALGNAEPRSP